MYKSTDTFNYAIFIEFLKLSEGGGYMQKTMHFALHFYMQQRIHFALRFYIQKAWHFALHFYMQKKCTLCYVFISKIYRIVLIPNQKHTYDQSNQIEK